MEEGPKIALFANFNNGFGAVGMFYGDHPAEPPKAFELFHNLKSLVATVLPSPSGMLLSFAQDLGEVGHAQASQKRSVYTVTTQSSHKLCGGVYKVWLDVCKTLPNGAVLNYTIQSIGSLQFPIIPEIRHRTNGYPAINRVGFAYEWPKDGSDDAAAQKAVITISKTVQSLAKTKGTLLDFKYMTFDTGSRKVLGSYGAENIKLMQEVAAKYDPEGVFQKLQNGGFLLRDNI
ncbi:hypothetical protein CBS133816_7774 [Aspergillus niger]|nr:hypothetical protein CBS133816_7774 [Aspergillus niger]